MSLRLCVSFYHWRPNRSSISKLLHWYYITWYLCLCSFELCPRHRSSICYFRRNYLLIPLNTKNCFKSHLVKSSFYYYIYWSKSTILSTTLSRIKWNTLSLFRLSRCLHNMEYCIFHRLNYILSRNLIFPIHSLRSYN